MKLAQTLYEGGHITYMRTDSVKYGSEFTDKKQVSLLKINMEKIMLVHSLMGLQLEKEEEEKRRKIKKEEKENKYQEARVY